MLGHGLLSPFNRHAARRVLESLLWRRVTCYIPSESECPADGCGYNSFTRSAVNPSCQICDGRGLVRNWSTGYLRVRPSWIDPARFNVYQGIVTAEIGDVQFQGLLRDQKLWERVRDTDMAYVLHDGYRLRPISITVNSVEDATTLDIRCSIVGSARE